MNITVILLSMASLFISSLIAGFAHRIFKKSKKIKPIYILLAGALIATFIIMLYVDFKPPVHGKHTTIFLALFHSIQVLLLGYDFEFLYETINITAEHSAFAYFYISALFLLAPIYTFSFVLSFFERFTSYLKYLWYRNRDIYIFSELSEKSLELARSIRKKFSGSVIAFANVFDESSETIFDLKEESRKIKALHFKKDISDMGLMFHSKNTKATFFTIGESEPKNFEEALAIIHNFNRRENTELYVFSNSKEGQLLLDSVKKGCIKARRINEDRQLAYSMLINNPITENYTEIEGNKVISTLIVGFGGYGSELTKALLWCGQLPDYIPEINVIDRNPLAESFFTAECPEIMQLNNNTEFGEARYSLNFYNGIDVHSNEFCKTVSSLRNTSVVYVSLGNDELNIETAVNLRVLFERIGLYPVIRTIVYSEIKYQMLNKSALTYHHGNSYDIEIIGTIKDRFTFDKITNIELELAALKCHLQWADTPEAIEEETKRFYEYEYFRSSSIASAIHKNYRSEKYTEDEIFVAEHMRWNAYMRTEGYIFSGSCEKSSRNDRAKMHNNLHRFGLLDDESIAKDRRVVMTGGKN